VTKVALVVAAEFEASDAVSGFGDIASAADEMAGTVSDAGDSVADAADQMGAVSDTAKDVSSNSRLASGSLGALAGGLDLVGASGAADTLREVQTVTSTLGGVGKALTLVLKSEKAAMVAQAVATKTVSAATKAYSVVQWALNAALTANPIGLIIVLIAALVAGVILAYKKSDTFREIVDRAFSVAKSAISAVVDVVKDVPGFIEKVIDKVGFLGPAFKVAKDLVVGYIDLVTLPIRTLIDLIQDVVHWIGQIDFPDPPGWLQDVAGAVTGRVSARGAAPIDMSPIGLGKGDVTVRVEGGFVGNETALARTIQAAVGKELRRRGFRP
jgi:phage-related protein